MWQVSGRSDITDFEEVVRLDKEYITNWNIGLDIKILFKTILVVDSEYITVLDNVVSFGIIGTALLAIWIWSCLRFAQKNGKLNAFSYLLSQRPNDKMSDEQLEQLAPWSETAKANCQN